MSDDEKPIQELVPKDRQAIAEFISNAGDLIPKEVALLARALPKWPQMRVAGEPVTVEQAKEIIRRTDSFFAYQSGNDHEWVESVSHALRMAPSWRHRESQSEEERLRLVRLEFAYRDRWLEKWGYLHQEYVSNDWLSCSFIGGPHGWVHPNGLIGYRDNVGKWPNCGDLFEEWKTIAATWPFLKLGVTLMSGESCEDEVKPIISFAVAGGQVEVVDPAERDVLAGYLQLAPRDHTSEVEWLITTSPRMREHGIPGAWIEEWAPLAQRLMDEDYITTFGKRLSEVKR